MYYLICGTRYRHLGLIVYCYQNLKMSYNKNVKSEDKKMSSIVSDFIRLNFYDKYTDNLEIVCDRERQVQGIDTIFSFEGREMYCDEKSAVRYRGIKTFSLELSFLNKYDDLTEGWFLSDNMKNDCYLFVWIDRSSSDTPDKKTITDISDITEAEIALVGKSNIRKYLERIGWTKEKIKEKERKIRMEGDRNFGNIFSDGCKFTFSEHLPEKPINILVPRRILRNIAMKDKIIRID